MALIVLLIFSQDDSFNKSIHETVSRLNGDWDWRFIFFLIILGAQTGRVVHGTVSVASHVGRSPGLGSHSNDTVQYSQSSSKMLLDRPPFI